MSDWKSKEDLAEDLFSAKGKITIIASLFNKEYVDALLENSLAELKQAKDVKIEVIRVSGAFEIPAFASICLAKNPKLVMIALGVVFQGETAHAKLITQSATNSLQNLAIQYQTVLIHQILFLKNKEEAKERCMGKLNRGKEAAQASLYTLKTLANLRGE